jgi:hypothetical protein
MGGEADLSAALLAKDASSFGRNDGFFDWEARPNSYGWRSGFLRSAARKDASNFGRNDDSFDWEAKGLSGSAEEEVGAGDAEEEVGGPGGEDGGEGVDVAEGFEDEGYYVVDNSEADGGGDSGEGALFAHR